MSIESSEGDSLIPDIIPDFSRDAEKGIHITCREAFGVMSRVQLLSEVTGIDAQEVFLRIMTFGVNTNGMGIYRVEEGYSSRLDLSDEEFASEPSIVETSLSTEKLQTLVCEFEPVVHEGLIESSIQRDMPVGEIMRRGRNLAIKVMEEIVHEGRQYYLREDDGGFKSDGVLLYESGQRMVVDVSYLHVDSADNDNPF